MRDDAIHKWIQIIRIKLCLCLVQFLKKFSNQRVHILDHLILLFDYQNFINQVWKCSLEEFEIFW